MGDRQNGQSRGSGDGVAGTLPTEVGRPPFGF